ncbi:MAG: DMT family transporter [Rhodoluna sp.]|nr:DMT family transporter [Rhodoluna sp.]
MSMKSPALLSAGDFMLLVVAAFWGATYLVVKDLGNVGSIGGMMAIRFVIAAAGLWAYWLFKRDKFQKQEWIMGIAFGISQTLVLNLEAYSVHFTSATNGGLIIALAIITVPILESAWRKNWLPYKFFIATSVAVIGLALLIMGNGFVEPNIGDLFMFIAMILRTFHFVILGRLTQGKTFSPVNLTTVMVSTSGLIMLIINPVAAIDTASTYSAGNWTSMLFLSLLCTSFAFIGMNWAVKHTSASRASLLLGTEPVWATIIAITIGGELIGAIGALGAVLVIGSTYWGQAIESKHRLK